ncbi:MAG: helix-turn-helix domain-containing protein [Halapricum sp.]
MPVIVELSLSATEFQLGRILSTEGGTTVTLETMVPLGDRSVPFFRVFGQAREAFEAQARDHHSVADLHVVSTHDGETLYALDWTISEGSFLDSVLSLDGHVLEARGGSDTWEFQLRFPSHSALSTFQESCFEADISINIKRIYNPTTPDAGPWYGLTTPQRETLSYAVEKGYYSLPRRSSTQDIAEEFGISDQAVTERLRRAIDTLVTNTLLLTADDD